MSDIRLFRLTNGKANAVDGFASHLEKPLQTLIEMNLDSLLGIRFVASEHSTGKTHGGRIDTLGLDENSCPVIIEYKRSSSENVINQGLYYLDWLMDHRAEFKLLVLERYGKQIADTIEWRAPRLVCIAADFTKYDGHAVQQINRNIELIRYRRFGEDLLLLELANAVSAASPEIAPDVDQPDPAKAIKPGTADKTVAEWLADMPATIAPIFAELEAYLTSLGDDVQRKDLKLYVAFKRLRNFVTVAFQNKALRLYLPLTPSKHPHIDGLTRDVSQIGHWGTGNLEFLIQSLDDLEKAKPYLLTAYQGEAV